MDYCTELRVHSFRHLNTVVISKNKCCTALARLRIDTNNRLIFSANIGRVNRKIRNFPIFCSALLHIHLALVDCVLMRAGKGCEHKLACIWLTRRNLHFCAALVNLFDFFNIVEIKLGVYALGPHIESQGHDINVACTLAVAEQSAFYTVCACHKSKLCSSYALSSVIVWVEGNNCCITIRQMSAKIFYLVCITVRSRALYCGWQIEYNRIFLSNMEFFHNTTANLYRIVHLSAGKGFGRIFEPNIHVRILFLFFLGQGINQLCAFDCNVNNAVHICFEHNLALKCRGRVIKMNDNILSAVNSLKCLFDKMRTSLNKNLNGNIIRNIISVNKSSQNLILCLTGRRKAYLNFFKANIDQSLKVFEFFFQIHRINQCLITVSKVNGAPYRRFCDGVIGPCTVRNVNRFEWDILFVALFHNKNLLSLLQEHNKSPYTISIGA